MKFVFDAFWGEVISAIPVACGRVPERQKQLWNAEERGGTQYYYLYYSLPCEENQPA